MIQWEARSFPFQRTTCCIQHTTITVCVTVILLIVKTKTKTKQNKTHLHLYSFRWQPVVWNKSNSCMKFCWALLNHLHRHFGENFPTLNGTVQFNLSQKKPERRNSVCRWKIFVLVTLLSRQKGAFDVQSTFRLYFVSFWSKGKRFGEEKSHYPIRGSLVDSFEATWNNWSSYS